MTQVTLSPDTQNCITFALAHGPGEKNVNYFNAYDHIYKDIKAHGGMDSGTLNWFSQAGYVNTEAFSPSAAGKFIWGYTQGASRDEGAIVSNEVMQQASNRIAHTVFQQLQDSHFVFDDAGNFSPKSIIKYDAGEGLKAIKQAVPGANLSNAVWGGTLFARTELNDKTYVLDNGLNISIGSRDCHAIFAGMDAGSASTLFSDPKDTFISHLSRIAQGAGSAAFSLDETLLEECLRNKPSSAPVQQKPAAGKTLLPVAPPRMRQPAAMGGM